MLRSLWLLMVFVFFIGIGTQAPFVLALGYVWVDTFRPQEVSYIILDQMPVALIMGAGAFGSYFLFDRRYPPYVNWITVVQLMLAVWVTITMIWAVSPVAAWEKWDWAFKTLIFAAFLPFVIRSRVQIDAFVQVYVLSLAANLLPFGAKIFLSGGGYGQSLGLTSSSNSGLSEGSTIAAVAVMTVPLALFLRKHTVLMPKNFIVRSAYLGIALVSLFTSVGTFERTGLVGLLVLGVALTFTSRHKLLVGVSALVVAAVIAYSTSSAWNARIDTIGNYQQDSSAMIRILVWKWTYNYVLSNPFGGGFNMYLINHIDLPDETTQYGRAFHSIYFEVLGEHGWVGLALFVSLLVGAQFMLHRTVRLVRDKPELLWCRDLAAALQVSLMVLTVCGAFIGIAFQPMIHYLLAMTVSVSVYARRVTLLAIEPKIPLPAWRVAAAEGG